MESIVVGFDGSKPAFIALDWAAIWASRRPSSVEIIRVDPGVIVEDDTDALAFGEAERRVLDVAPDSEVTSRVVVGRMPDALIDSAAQAELLVIGAHRGRRIRSAMTGWRPLRMVAKSTVPTVVVPDDWSASAGPVVVGIDDDDSSSSALDFAAREAAAIGAELVLVHAWQMPVPRMEGAVALQASPIEVKAAHRRIVDDASARALHAHPGLTVRRVIVQDNPIAALLTAARECSLLVLGTHHRGILEGAFLGSTAQDTLPSVAIPVCVVPHSVAVPAMSEHR